MTEPSQARPAYAVWTDWIVRVAAVAAVGAAAVSLSRDAVDLTNARLVGGGFLVLALALARRFAVGLPGRQTASFKSTPVLIALLLSGWEVAVAVGVVGTFCGDLWLRRLPLREVLVTPAHAGMAAGAAALLYALLGGATGPESLDADNLGPLIVVLLAHPFLIDGSYYLVVGLRDFGLTLRWDSIVTVLSAGLAVGWVALLTADVSTGAFATLGGLLMGAFGLASWMVEAAARADELRMVQSFAGTVAGEVSIERSFARIQELARRLVPWEQMGFAGYDAGAHTLELMADTHVTPGVRFSPDDGITAHAIAQRRAVVLHERTYEDPALPSGLMGQSEIVVPLFQGEELVGIWNVRHSEPNAYRTEDAHLLDLLAPQLALSIALSALVRPVAASTEQTFSYARAVAQTTGVLRRMAEGVAGSAARAEEEATRAANRVSDAVDGLSRLVEGVHEMMSAAETTLDVTGAMADRAVDVRGANATASDQLVELGEQISAGASEVAHLREASQEVERFAEAIASIAAQTNLLALNATIEAARAGKQGQGFSVVASEVRNLAEESATAARNMGRGAKATIGIIDRAAQVMEAISGRVSEIIETSTRWRSDLDAIAQAAEETRRAGERVAATPRANLALADAAAKVLGEAREAASRSADEAASVARDAAEQRRAAEELGQGAQRLTDVAERLAGSVRFIEGHVDAATANGTTTAPDPASD